MWWVTRQRYRDNALAVELTSSLCSEDRLDQRYAHLGEWNVYARMSDAVDAVVRIRRAWESATDEPVAVTIVPALNCVHELATVEELRQLADTQAATPACIRCGGTLPSKPIKMWNDSMTQQLMPDCCSVECMDDFIEQASLAYLGRR